MDVMRDLEVTCTLHPGHFGFFFGFDSCSDHSLRNWKRTIRAEFKTRCISQRKKQGNSAWSLGYIRHRLPSSSRAWPGIGGKRSTASARRWWVQSKVLSQREGTLTPQNAVWEADKVSNGGKCYWNGFPLPMMPIFAANIRDTPMGKPMK